jgi:hypothetical protein
VSVRGRETPAVAAIPCEMKLTLLFPELGEGSRKLERTSKLKVKRISQERAFQ